MRALAASLPPPLSATTNAARKGNCGKVVIIGGSNEYTGAPYFAGISALRSGADLAWVICAPAAGIPIKSLAPDLIVIPTLASLSGAQLVHPSNTTSGEISAASSAIARATSFVVGPGLGRSQQSWNDARAVIDEARVSGRPVVVDGDALWWCANDLSAIRGHPTAVLTPNAGELLRLCEKTGVSSSSDLAAVLGVAVLAKGATDQFTWGSREPMFCTKVGAPRRCGGQGDVLAGSLGTWLSWAYNTTLIGNRTRADRVEAAVLAAATVTRVAAAKAFERNKRGMITADVIALLPEAMEECFPWQGEGGIL